MKAESLEYEQVQDLFEVRPEEDASYSADWEANRQRALGLVSHIADSASLRKSRTGCMFMFNACAVDAYELEPPGISVYNS